MRSGIWRSRGGFLGPGLLPPRPGRRGSVMGSPVCAWASVVAVSRPPAAVAANMFRREIGFETTVMMLSLRWRRHDAPQFSLFGKRLTWAIPYAPGRKFVPC